LLEKTKTLFVVLLQPAKLFWGAYFLLSILKAKKKKKKNTEKQRNSRLEQLTKKPFPHQSEKIDFQSFH
jgi:hypothetical protein